MNEVIALLRSLGIPFTHYNHPAVYTCDEATLLCPPMPGAHTKQLLIHDKKARNVFLLIVMHDKRVDMNALAKELHVGSLSFASSELLFELLRVTPGSVTPLGLTHDTAHRISVFIDEDAWAIGTFLFHPLVNTATLSIEREGFERFLSHTGHSYAVLSIPRRTMSAATV